MFRWDDGEERHASVEVVERFGLCPWAEPARARAYLNDLVADLLAGVHEYVLPCEAVFGSIDPSKLDRTSSAFGPVPHPEDYRRLADPERQAVVERRFGLYFETLLPSGEAT